MTDTDKALERWDEYAKQSSDQILQTMTLCLDRYKILVYQAWAHNELVRRGWFVRLDDYTASQITKVKYRVTVAIKNKDGNETQFTNATLLKGYLDAIKATEVNQ